MKMLALFKPLPLDGFSAVRDGEMEMPLFCVLCPVFIKCYCQNAGAVLFFCIVCDNG